MGTVDQPRDERGRWSVGAAGGDHQAEARSPSDRRVVVAHAQPSVGVRLSTAARDLIVRNKGIDQRHFPNRTADNLSRGRDLGMREPPNAADFAMSALRRRH